MVAVLVLLLTVPVAIADERQWINLFNQSADRWDLAGMEKAAHAAESAAFLSLSRNVVEATFVPAANWNRPLPEIEPQGMWFWICVGYLNRVQAPGGRTEKGIENLRVCANRLWRVASLTEPWLATRLLIARSREIDGGAYDILILGEVVPIPQGMSTWTFWIGGNSPIVTDVSTEYDKQWRGSPRNSSVFGSWCVLVPFLCLVTLKFRNDTIISLLQYPVFLNVSGSQAGLIDYTGLRSLVAKERGAEFPPSGAT